MKAIIDNGRPAIRRLSYESETGVICEVTEFLDIDSARTLLAELSSVIKECVRLEAVRGNK